MSNFKKKARSFIDDAVSYVPLTSRMFCTKVKDACHHLCHRHRISLAVAGEISSGKSFLLQDIYRSFNVWGTTFSTLKKSTGELYEDFGLYRPDENGGSGGTPLYAYRLNRHYGGYTDEMGGFELDFLNIPGEAFFLPNNNATPPLDAYENLKHELLQYGRFRVRLYWNGTTFKKVVEPIKLTDKYKSGKESQTVSNVNLNMQYRDCDEFYGFLFSQDYKECKALGYPKKINGKTLLKNFFDYDADSVMLALSDFVEKQQPRGQLRFDLSAFEADYKLRFPFIHYCACASDIVVCDRVFVPDTGENNASTGFNFDQFCQALRGLRNRAYSKEEKNFYLAFRNVDFFMKAKEHNYKTLHSGSKNILEYQDANKNMLRNAVYSLFHYSMMNILYGFHIDTDDFLYQIIGGTPEFRNENEAALKATLRDCPTDYIDLEGNGGTPNGCIDGKEHIKSRIGVSGGGTGFLPLLGQLANAAVYPHIYFTCTPMTLDGEIYTNGADYGFEYTKDGRTLYFRDAPSKAFFGSYQLCINILSKHGIGQFDSGDLLRQIQR